MNAEIKLHLLSEDARFESCDSFTPRRTKRRGKTGAADGTSKALFRVLQSNSCEWDCPYCPLRRSNDVERATLLAEEVAQLFMARLTAGAVDGLFLSSAVDGGLRPGMGRMLDTVELLRVRYE